MIRTKLLHPEPYPGESLSHYLGRLRRLPANSLPSASALGNAVGIGAVVCQWEQGFFNPFPSVEQLATLAAVIGLNPDTLAQMLPSKEAKIDPRPIRLCGACYAESPCHCIEWQVRSKLTPRCDRHKLKLLMKCPECGTLFPVPSLWVEGRCQNRKCGMRYSRMARHQLTIMT